MSTKRPTKPQARHSRESGNPVPSTPNEDNTPDGWETTTFRAVCLRGKQWNPSKEPREHFEYIDVSAVSRESCEIEQPQRTDAKAASSRARKIVHAGDCLFATIRPRLLRVAHVGPEYHDQIASTAFCVLRPNPEKAVSRFLYFLLRCDFIVDAIASHESGASYPAVSDGNVLDCEIHLPPKSEQQKIAAVLWKMQRAIATQDHLITTTRDLKQSAMQHLFTRGLRGEPLKDTEIGPIPLSWMVIKGSELFKLSSGSLRPKELSPVATVEKPYPVLGGNGVMGYADSFLIDQDKIIVIGRVGEYCGATHLTSGKVWITDNALYVKQWIFESANADFVSQYLAHYDLNRFKRQAGQPLVTQGTINELFFALPEPNEQRAIAAALATIDRKLAHHQKKRAALNDLFQTTLHQLMTAQIRVADLDIDTSEVTTPQPQGVAA